MQYIQQNLDELYERQREDAEEYIYNGKGVTHYRTKTIKSGEMLEVEIYPIYLRGFGGARAKADKPSREAQNNLNDKNAKKRVIRLMNANFTSNDIWATFTYDDEHLPKDEKDAKKDMQNYIRRLNNHVKKSGLPALNYIYTTEHTEGDKGVRVHHHIVMSFNDRDMAEKLWTKGGRTHTRRLQPDDYGLEGMARYITKTQKEKKTDGGARTATKRYTTSKGLKKPIESISDTKFSKRRGEKTAKDQNGAKELFEKLYKGYTFNDIAVRFSDYISGAYIYVRMRRTPP